MFHLLSLHCKRAVALGLLGVFVTACYWSVRLARADFYFRKDTPDEVARAIQLAPGNAGYYVRWAALSDPERDQPYGQNALWHALTLNQWNSQVWIELGLRAETGGWCDQAEAYLMNAVRVDRTFLPRSTLANYYFRQGNRERFWYWTREALLTAPQDPVPLFRLCWALDEDAGDILKRAIPNRPDALRHYLRFLLDTSRLDAAGPVAELIQAAAQQRDRALLVAYCDRLLANGATGPAMRVWNSMLTAGILAHDALDPSKDHVLTNGRFRSAPSSYGFDWRVPSIDGVAASFDEGSSCLRISFSGKQPESCTVLWQHLPLLPRARYRLSFRYRTVDVGVETGLRWRITESATKPVPPDESHSLSSDDWTRDTFTFVAPDTHAAAKLELVYRRAPGSTRIRGAVFLKDIELTTIQTSDRHP